MAAAPAVQGVNFRLLVRGGTYSCSSRGDRRRRSRTRPTTLATMQAEQLEEQLEEQLLQALLRCDGARYGWPSVSELVLRKGVRRPLGLWLGLVDKAPAVTGAAPVHLAGEELEKAAGVLPPSTLSPLLPPLLRGGRCMDNGGQTATQFLRGFLLARPGVFRVDGEGCVVPLQQPPLVAVAAVVTAAAAAVAAPATCSAVTGPTPLCGTFALLGRCGASACGMRHEFCSAAEQDHAAWRVRGRRGQLARAEAQLVAAVSANRLDPWPFPVVGRLARVGGPVDQSSAFADWLLAACGGREVLSAGIGVLDVAGGHGGLARALARRGVGCVVVDPLSLSAHQRRQPEPGPENGPELSSSKATTAAATTAAAANSTPPLTAAAADVPAAVTQAVPTTEQLSSSKATTAAATTAAAANSTPPLTAAAADVPAAATQAVPTTESEPEPEPGTVFPRPVHHQQAAVAQLQPAAGEAFVRELFDASFVERRRDLLDACSIVVGLHPDEATGGEQRTAACTQHTCTCRRRRRRRRLTIDGRNCCDVLSCAPIAYAASDLHHAPCQPSSRARD
jgi:hypothetical protein